MKEINTKWFSSISLILTVTVAALHPAQPVNAQAPPAAAHASKTSSPIPLDQLGAVAGKQYQGGGLAVTATPDGARLRCVFQRLEGQATSEGLWLTSTAESPSAERFRIVAVAVGRKHAEHAGLHSPVSTLPAFGIVKVEDKVVRFQRPGVMEEYSVSVDGLRQDFVVTDRPAGAGELRVELALGGAQAEKTAYGAKLTMAGSGRALAYTRLRVTDASGQQLTACLEVVSAHRLLVRVEDAYATYPVRIDPTFSDADWISLNVMPGAESPVGVVVADSIGNVYISGNGHIGGQRIYGIAKWDGTTWSTLGQGLGQAAQVYALAVSGTNLYVGGQFDRAGGVSAANIAKWDGSSWSALGLGVMSGSGVRAIAVSGADLYVGGNFAYAGDVAARNIAKWDGSTWSALGPGVMSWVWDSRHGIWLTNGSVYALAASGANLYAGGTFFRAGNVSATNIAKWDGSTWSGLGQGLGAPYSKVNALVVIGSDLYAGGEGFPVSKWDGGAWSALGPYSQVYALASSGTNLYVGGGFSIDYGAPADGIARWNGSEWSPLGAGIYGAVSALAVSGTNIYAGGNFRGAGGGPAWNIAKWNGSEWSAFGDGIGGWPGYYGVGVSAFAVSGSDLYVGGFFTGFGGIAVTSIAKWNGDTWSALGAGVSLEEDPYYVDPWVNALALSGSNLYVGGYFTKAGGVAATNIAKWDGRSWSALGPGIAQYDPMYLCEVAALAVSGTNLYVGGYFTRAGGVSVTNIAKWDGQVWSALGSGLDGFVYALAPSGPDLYAGGDFITADGMTVNCVAKWNGNSWSALGAGLHNDDYPAVYALMASGTDLYAGGTFTNAGNVPANYIAKWDGITWSALGGGLELVLNDPLAGVKALAMSGSDIYAAGEFFWAGDVTARSVAKWNGTSWSALGTGTDDIVRALATDGAGHLFVGGDFTYAGTNPSPYFAQANIALLGGRLRQPLFSSVNGFSCTFWDGSVGQPYRIQASPSLTNGSWNDLTNFTYTEPTVITDTSAVAGPKKFYRAVTP